MQTLCVHAGAELDGTLVAVKNDKVKIGFSKGAKYRKGCWEKGDPKPTDTPSVPKAEESPAFKFVDPVKVPTGYKIMIECFHILVIAIKMPLTSITGTMVIFS